MSGLLPVGTRVSVRFIDYDDGTPSEVRDAVVVELDTDDPELPYYVELDDQSRTWASPDEVSAK